MYDNGWCLCVLIEVNRQDCSMSFVCAECLLLGCWGVAQHVLMSSNCMVLSYNVSIKDFCELLIYQKITIDIKYLMIHR